MPMALWDWLGLRPQTVQHQLAQVHMATGLLKEQMANLGVDGNLRGLEVPRQLFDLLGRKLGNGVMAPLANGVASALGIS